VLQDRKFRCAKPASEAHNERHNEKVKKTKRWTGQNSIDSCQLFKVVGVEVGAECESVLDVSLGFGLAKFEQTTTTRFGTKKEEESGESGVWRR
jgi:hypothetical protein